MTCPWLMENEELLTLAALGELPESSDFWPHIQTCDECRAEFADTVEILELLQSIPWENPPRLIYLQTPPRRVLGRMSPTLRYVTLAATILIMAFLGFAAGRIFWPTSPQSTQPAGFFGLDPASPPPDAVTSEVCQTIVKAELSRLQDELMRRQEEVLSSIIARLDNQEATVMRINNDLLDLRHRQENWVTHTSSQLQRIKQAVATSSDGGGP